MFAIDGSLAYLGFNSCLEIIDVADPAALVSISSTCDLFGSDPSEILVREGLAYTAAPGEIAILDVSEPKLPVVVGELPLSDWFWTMALSDSLLFVSGYRALYVVNVSIPSKPRLLSTTSLDRAQGLALEGNYLYVSTSYDFHIFDVADPTMPVMISSLPEASSADAVVFDDGLCFLVGGGLTVLDVTNPVSPSIVARISHPVTNSGQISRRAVLTPDQHLYVSAGNEGLLVYDVSSVSLVLPIGRSSISVGDSVRAIAISGCRAFLASDGIVSVDLSAPGAPRELSITRPAVQYHDVAVRDTLLFAAGISSSGVFEIFSVAPGNCPRLLRSVNAARWLRGLALLDEFAIAAGDGGIFVFDIAPPESAHVVASDFGQFDFNDIVVEGPAAYAGTGANVWILDVSDPRKLAFREGVNAPTGTRLSISGGRLFVSIEGRFEARVLVMDLVDPFSPEWLGEYATLGEPNDVVTDGDQVYIATASGLEIWSACDERFGAGIGFGDGSRLSALSAIQGADAFIAAGDGYVYVFAGACER